MGTNSKIEWTNHTWNPWRGCTKVSPACDNCYMFRDMGRYGHDAATVQRQGDKTFQMPVAFIHGGRPQPGWLWPDGNKVFACSWSDFFHPDADAWRDEAWEIIRRRPGLVFQLLTKRPELILTRLPLDWGEGWPNVWLGVTAENQEQADKRICRLLETPAAIRFVSIEPMLGSIDLTRLDYFRAMNERLTPEERRFAPSLKWNALSDDDGYNAAFEFQTGEELSLLDWVIVGGESGPKARPMNPDWVRRVRDQCQAAGVPFFFKQWGEWAPNCLCGRKNPCKQTPRPEPGGMGCMFRCGKKEAGSTIDNQEWKEFPEHGEGGEE